MSYLALYRKYRPQIFDQLVGQPHVARALRNAVREGRISHAYLFSGPRGTGKTTTARLLAKALNCERGATPEPCGVCEACTRIARGSALDIIEIDAASKTSVDDIRDLRERVQTAPAVSRYKVYIVDEVHMLSTSAFNAFLKTLEEPPSYVIFVLCTTEPHKLPATVLSRCQRYDFRRLSVADLTQLVNHVAQQEGITLESAAVALLVRAAWGSARDALSLLEQAVSYAGANIVASDIQAIVGAVDVELLADFADAIADHNVDEAFHLAAKAMDDGRDLRQLATDLTAHFRDLLLLRVCRHGEDLVALSEGGAARVKAQSQRMPEQEISRAAQILSETERELRRSEQQRLTFELALVRLTAPLVESPAGAQAAEAAEASRPAVAAPPARPKPAAKPARTRAVRAAEPATQPQAAAAAALEAEPDAEAAGPLSLDELQQRWPAMLEKLRTQRRSTVAAFLAESLPIELSGKRLVLGFNHEFHLTQMKAPPRQKVVADLIAAETGMELSIECRMREVGERPAAGGDNLQDIMSIFPGSEVV